MSITPMTIGQFKQVIRRLDGGVPTNLTYGEADLFSKSAAIGGEMRAFWFRVRNMPREVMTVYPIHVGDSVSDRISNNHIELADGHLHEPELKSILAKAPAGDSRLEAVEICEISYDFESVDAARYELKQRGYVSVGFEELVAFAVQHSDYFARIGCVYVYVLEETNTGKLPLIWYDDNPSGYAHLQLSFERWDHTDFVAVANDIPMYILVKKL